MIVDASPHKIQTVVPHNYKANNCTRSLQQRALSVNPGSSPHIYAVVTNTHTTSNKKPNTRSFSNSAPYLSILAPGAMLTAGGKTFGGTSQAAPHVAGERSHAALKLHAWG